MYELDAYTQYYWQMSRMIIITFNNMCVIDDQIRDNILFIILCEYIEYLK